MKRLAFALSLLLSTAAALAFDPPKVDPAKAVTVTLPVQDWQAVLASVGDSDRVSARDAGRITQAVIAQIQPQIAPSSQPPKK